MLVEVYDEKYISGICFEIHLNSSKLGSKVGYLVFCDNIWEQLYYNSDNGRLSKFLF